MKTPVTPLKLVSVTALILLCLLSATRSVFAQAAITNVPGLGGSVHEATAFNNHGMIAGFSYTAGDADSHAFLFANGAVYDLGGFFSLASAINGSGQVTGDSLTLDTFENHAFLFTVGGNMDLGTLGGTFSTAAGINDSGKVAGTASLSGDSISHAFLYSGGTMSDLGTLGGSLSSAAAINNAGQIVGDSYTTNDLASHAFLFSAGVMYDLGTLGGPSSSAKALNSAGQVAGDAHTTNSQTHAFFFSAGVMSDIGTLGGAFSNTRGLNNLGQVIGESEKPNHATHAFLYGNGVLTDLGTLGGANSSAAAINNLGQVVGDSQGANGTGRAFLWSNGTMSDLNILLPPNSGWVLQSAEFINDAGQIVGFGTFNGNFDWFLLTPPSNRPPVANAGPAQTVQCPDLAALDGSGSSDPDGDSLTYVWREGSTVLANGVSASVPLGVGSHTIELTVTDSHGASAQAAVVMTVVDTAVPTVICPNSVTVAADANCQGVVPDFAAAAVASDNCTPGAQLGKTQSPAAGTVVGIGAHLITVTVSDAVGNNGACTTTFTVADTTAPIVSCPAAVSASADANCEAPVPDVLAGVSASDNCTPGAQLTKTQSPQAGRLMTVGTHTITVTVTDAAGNAGVCTTTFTVVDTIAPVVSCPAPVTASADATCQAAVPNLLSGVSASDNCTPSAQLTKTQSPAAGTLLGLGAHVVTITVSDASGNASTCTTTFTVIDTTAPVVSCPAAVTVSADANCQGVVPDFLTGVTASDNCTPAAQLVKTQNPAAGTLLGSGPHPVTITVTDAAGNLGSCTTTFTLADTVPPVISCPAPVAVAANANCQAAVPDFLAGVIASDNCTPAAQLSKTQNPAAGTLMGVGAHVVTVTVSDASGNVSTCTTTFTVSDATAPVINSVTTSPNVLLNPDGALVPVSVSVSASDNCDSAPFSHIISVTSNEPVTGPGDKTSPDWVITGDLSVNLRAERLQKGSGRIYTITVMSTDAAGNSSTGTTTVAVPRR